MHARRFATLTTLAALACGVALAFAQPGARKPDTAQIAQGRYLVQVIGCGDCHTPGWFYGAADPDRAFSGSEVGWKGPWGVHYAANLTPDLDTGLGYWTQDELAKALRTGKRPDGTAIGAPMPVEEFKQLSEPDAQAIAAYLLSLKPVSHQVPKAVKPGGEVKGPAVEFPPPSAWDAPRPAPAAPAGERK